MSVEWMYGHEEVRHKTYRSPQEMLLQDVLARQAYQRFLGLYVGDPRSTNRLRGDLPPIEQLRSDDQPQAYRQEMFTGYGGLGELVHIRVEPKLADAASGYFVALGNLQSGEVEEPVIRRVERFQDFKGGSQTVLYLDDDRCEEWPPEYQPMICFDQNSFRFTYKPGFGQGESLLRPIDGLLLLSDTPEAVPTPRPASEPMGRRVLELVHFVE